jgi:hypothetical protein
MLQSLLKIIRPWTYFMGFIHFINNLFSDSLSNSPQSSLGERIKAYSKNAASTNGCLPYSPEKVIYKG